MNEIEIWVPGEVRPAGSKRGFRNKKTGRIIITDANPKAKDWKASVAHAACEVVAEVLTCPLAVRMDFIFTRPKGHYGSGKNCGALKDSAPPHPAGRPDCGKAARGTEDALTGIVWRDDSQIVTEVLTKRYGPQAGCRIRVREEKA